MTALAVERIEAELARKRSAAPTPSPSLPGRPRWQIIAS
jgi:hypothetical protein